MLRVLCIGDPHFKNDNGEETHAMTDSIQKLVMKRKPDIVAILGDILHRHEKIDLHPFHRANNFLKIVHRELMKYGGFLYIVIGNHDRSNNTIFQTDEHVFNPLKEWPNTFVADTAIFHRGVGAISGAEFGCVIVPYVPPGRLIEAIASIDPDFIRMTDCISDTDDDHSSKDHGSIRLNLDELDYSDKFRESVNIVFVHQEFAGAKMNTITSNIGDPWPEANPLCMAGHIHDYQMLGKNLIYTGTPIQHGFADSTKKTVSWIEVNTNPIRVTEGGVRSEFTEERISLRIKGRRQFNIKADEFIDNYKHFSVEAEECYVKLKITGLKTSLKNLTKLPEYKRLILKPTVKVQLLETVDSTPVKTLNSETKTQVSFRQRLEEVLKESPDLMKEFQKIFRK